MTNAVGPSRRDMLGVYLNDHLAGARAGSELASRMARSHQGREDGVPLSRRAVEIAQDRSALLAIMASLGVTVCGYRVTAGAGSHAGQLEELRIRAASRVISDGSAAAPAALDRAAAPRELPG